MTRGHSHFKKHWVWDNQAIFTRITQLNARWPFQVPFLVCTLLNSLSPSAHFIDILSVFYITLNVSISSVKRWSKVDFVALWVSTWY